METVLPVLFEKVVLDKNNAALLESVYRLVRFFYERDCSSKFMSPQFLKHFSSENKKWKLGISLIVRSLIESLFLQSSSLRQFQKRNISLLGLEETDLLYSFKDFIPPFVMCIIKETIFENNTYIPTRLTICLVDVTLLIFYAISLSFLSSGTNISNGDWFLSEMKPFIIQLFDQLIKWNSKHRVLFTVGLEGIKKLFQSYESTNFLQVLKACCTLFPFILEENKQFQFNMKKEVHQILTQMKQCSNYNNIKDRDYEIQNSLLSLCFIFGKLKTKQSEELFSTFHSQLIKLITRQVSFHFYP